MVYIVRGEDVEEGNNSQHGDKGEEVAESFVLSRLIDGYFPPSFLSFYFSEALLGGTALILSMGCIQFYLIRLLCIYHKNSRDKRSIESGLPPFNQVHHLEEDFLKMLPMLETDEGYYLHDVFQPDDFTH